MAEREIKGKEKKQAWLKELAEFIVEANRNTWAADGAEVEPEREGYKELEYKRGDWRLRDSYTGYFRAPGMTTVYHHECPVWTMAYSGGMVKGSGGKLAESTFKFLRSALMRVAPDEPYRGPNYEEGEWRYSFELQQGDVTDFLWKEEIYKEDKLVFNQTGIGGIVVFRRHRGPALPWH